MRFFIFPLAVYASLISSDIITPHIHTHKEEQIGKSLLEKIILYKEMLNDGAEEAVAFQDLDVPDQRALVVSLEPYLKKPITEDAVFEIKSAIHRHFQKNNRPFLIVMTPNQDLTEGCLKIKVIEGKAGEVCVCGNRWFSSERYAVPLHKGNPIDFNCLMNRIAWINRNPFRSAELVFSPGDEKGYTNLTVLANDRFPLRLYGGGDNTGNPATGQTRWYGGFNWGNAFGADQFLSYQFTSAANTQFFSAHTLQYIFPLPNRTLLNFYGGYSHVRGDLNGYGMNFRGWGAQASGRYQIPIPKLYGPFLQTISFGYDFKRTNNGLEFGEEVVSKTFADINQWVIDYSLDYSGWAKCSFQTQIYGSPFRMTSHQSKKDYQMLQPKADPLYAYARTRLTIRKALWDDAAIAGLVALQGASTNLLPSEKFGLGGYDTVRGYDERQFNADLALLASVEFRFPPITLIRAKCHKDKLEILTFIDYGWGRNFSLFAGEKPQGLLGIGPGVRYTIAPYLFFRSDVGFQLIHIDVGPKRMLKWHAGGTLSF